MGKLFYIGISSQKFAEKKETQKKNFEQVYWTTVEKFGDD